MLILEHGGRTEKVRLDAPEDVNALFARLHFPGAHVGSGIHFSEEPTGPRVLLHRSYLQAMPGESQKGRLIWCCELWPDREPEAPGVLTPLEAKARFGIS